MAGQVKTALLLVGLCVALSSAAQLLCRVGEANCEGWTYTGQINADVVCCPALSGQSMTMDRRNSPPNDCVCNVGRQEDADTYASGHAITASALTSVLTALFCVLKAL